MIFRNINMDRDYKGGYLLVDDIVEGNEPIPIEILKSISPTKGKTISGTLGTFNIKDFEGITGRLKDV